MRRWFKHPGDLLACVALVGCTIVPGGTVYVVAQEAEVHNSDVQVYAQNSATFADKVEVERTDRIIHATQNVQEAE